jgi:glycosyltransferase involved in cell wall biosynthesis
MSSLSFSIVVPVYNRPEEVKELLESLVQQSDPAFEVVLVEDGSTEDCRSVVDAFQEKLNISYYYKENSGPGDSRNYGMRKAHGNYYLIFDSDCLIPHHYIATVRQALTSEFVDCFGGPDAAHHSFSDLQKAINYSMTSFFTTGGIRGKKSSVSKFQPRSFNMGISQKAFEITGGFGKIHPGEDPDLSLRIWAAGMDTRLIEEAYVFHKRRISFSKFYQQVLKFGMVRPILNKWHPEHSKLIFWMPSLFLCFVLLSLLGGLFISAQLLIPLLTYTVLLFSDALIQCRNVQIAMYAVLAAYIQLMGYGWGFIQSFVQIQLLHREEEKAFPQLFFN